MRTILVFLTALFIVSAHYILADELILGRVLSVDQPRGTVSLEVLDGPDELMKSGREGLAHPPNNLQESRQPSPVVITISRKLLPGDIRVNSMVRVWGAFDRSSGQFNPLNTTGSNMPGMSNSFNGHHDDMTGVRHRIGRGGRTGGMGSIPGGSSGSFRKGGGGAGGHHGR